MSPMPSPHTDPIEALEARLTELEIKSSFQEDLLDTLNQTIVRQQEQIDLLVREVLRLKQQGPSDGASMRSLREELPPHY